MTIHFNGFDYHDDRMFILYLCKATLDTTPNPERIHWTTIHHEGAPAGHLWCVATYRNSNGYPIFRVDHFRKREDAISYMMIVEPEVPLVSLNGLPPSKPKSFQEFTDWKNANGLKEYDYRTVFTPGGTNPRESVGHSADNFQGIR